MSKKNHIPDKAKAWIDARKRCHLSDAHIVMAKELGMTPKRLEKLSHSGQQQW